MHYSLNKTLKLPIRCQNLNKFACKYRFYWLSEGGPLFKLLFKLAKFYLLYGASSVF